MFGFVTAWLLLRGPSRNERQIPAGNEIRAVLGNDATHNHPKVLACLSRHPRWPPLHSDFHVWLNAVENFFSSAH
jgi:hypothetical protein